MKQYISRLVDDILSFKLRNSDEVWIKGPKWCGKSTTAEQFANTVIKMQDEENKKQSISLAKMSPTEFLKGKTPVLIDEWQIIQFIWNQIRTEVDKRDVFGQFLLGRCRHNIENGDWTHIEIKLGSQELIDEGAHNLLKLVDSLDPKSKKPSFLMVLTGTNTAYIRDDGVWVVPLACLGP